MFIHTRACTHLTDSVGIHLLPVYQFTHNFQVTMVACQIHAVIVFLQQNTSDTSTQRSVVHRASYPVPETGVEPSLLNEVPHHFGVALLHCLVETVLSKVVHVKPAVSKFRHEVLDNLQVATNGSKVEGVHKVLWRMHTGMNSWSSLWCCIKVHR